MPLPGNKRKLSFRKTQDIKAACKMVDLLLLSAFSSPVYPRHSKLTGRVLLYPATNAVADHIIFPFNVSSLMDCK